jgi:hypothetical protein
MRYRLNRGPDGTAYSATVTLTERERTLVRLRRVPMIYSPGGMGPADPVDSATVSFGGACYVDVEPKLLACLAAFRAALQTEMQHEDAQREANEAEARGFEAFPAGRFMDAMRGTKGFPDAVRCPYRQPDRAAAWQRGYDAAHAALHEGRV